MMKSENLIAIPEQRIAIATLVLEELAKAEHIKYFGGIGSFWTNKERPDDFDVAAGIQNLMNKQNIRLKLSGDICSRLVKAGLPKMKVDIAYFDYDIFQTWKEVGDPSTLFFLLKAKDIVGKKPNWMNLLETNIPTMMIN